MLKTNYFYDLYTNLYKYKYDLVDLILLTIIQNLNFIWDKIIEKYNFHSQLFDAAVPLE